MSRCIYGHPLSGSAFIKEFQRCSIKIGYKRSDSDKALFIRTDENEKVVAMICCYVDDLVAAGGGDELKRLWRLIELSGWRFDAPGKCSRFLGVNINRYESATHRHMDISMTEYIESIENTYERLFGVKPKPANSPCSEDVRASPTMLSSITARTPLHEQKEVQTILGMTLWCGRCVRPDIMSAVSFLCSRVSIWDQKCQRQLERLVGFLYRTRSWALNWAVPRDIEYHQLVPVCYFDADVPSTGSRAQTGVVNVLQTIDGKTVLTFDWISSRQTLIAVSTTVAELQACFAAVKIANLPLEFSRWLSKEGKRPTTGCGVMDDSEILLRGDNLCPIRSSLRGSEAINMVAKHVCHRRRVAILQELRLRRVASIFHVRSLCNIADCLTKGMSAIGVRIQQTLLGIKHPLARMVEWETAPLALRSDDTIEVEGFE